MEHLQDIYYLNLNTVYRTGGLFSPPMGTPWRLEDYSAFCQNKFYFVTEGSFWILIDGKEYIAHPGSWFFIPAGVSHKYRRFPDKPMAKHWVHFDIYPSTGLFFPLNIEHHVDASNSPEVWRLFEEFSRICESHDLSDRLKVKAILLNLLAEYLKLSGRQKVKIYSEKDEELRNVLSYMHENFRRNMTTGELSAICHMHPTHFIRAFKSKMGLTPQQYVLTIRMAYAKQMLDQSDFSILAIAEEIGFYDVAHFSRVFKQHFSMSPSEYRRTAPGTNPD